jgi:hypothetical protein
VARKITFVIPIEKKNEIKDEILYVPGVNSNLLFIGILIDKGWECSLTFKRYSTRFPT